MVELTGIQNLHSALQCEVLRRSSILNWNRKLKAFLWFFFCEGTAGLLDTNLSYCVYKLEDYPQGCPLLPHSAPFFSVWYKKKNAVHFPLSFIYPLTVDHIFEVINYEKNRILSYLSN